jgi:hypothetical protein
MCTHPDMIRQVNATRIWWAGGRGKAEGKRPLGRQACLGEWNQNGSWGVRLGGIEWILLAWDRNRWRAVVNAMLNPSGTGATDLASYSYYERQNDVSLRGNSRVTLLLTDYVRLTL